MVSLNLGASSELTLRSYVSCYAHPPPRLIHRHSTLAAAATTAVKRYHRYASCQVPRSRVLPGTWYYLISGGSVETSRSSVGASGSVDPCGISVWVLSASARFSWQASCFAAAVASADADAAACCRCRWHFFLFSFFFFSSHSLSSHTWYLLFSLLPTRNSDPGSHT